MRASICCIAALMGAMGIATDVAAVENDAGLAGKRGLSPIIPMAAQASGPKAATQVVKTIWLGGSFLWDSPEFRANGINWTVADNVCYSLQEEGWFRANGLNAAPSKCAVSSIERSPIHGKLALQADGVTYNYMPENGFVGKDMIVFIVNAEGKKIRVMWPVFVTEHEFKGEGESSQ